MIPMRSISNYWVEDLQRALKQEPVAFCDTPGSWRSVSVAVLFIS